MYLNLRRHCNFWALIDKLSEVLNECGYGSFVAKFGLKDFNDCVSIPLNQEPGSRRYPNTHDTGLYLKVRNRIIFFFISLPNHILYVFKRTVSLCGYTKDETVLSSTQNVC